MHPLLKSYPSLNMRVSLQSVLSELAADDMGGYLSGRSPAELQGWSCAERSFSVRANTEVSRKLLDFAKLRTLQYEFLAEKELSESQFAILKEAVRLGAPSALDRRSLGWYEKLSTTAEMQQSSTRNIRRNLEAASALLSDCASRNWNGPDIRPELFNATRGLELANALLTDIRASLAKPGIDPIVIARANSRLPSEESASIFVVAIVPPADKLAEPIPVCLEEAGRVLKYLTISSTGSVETLEWQPASRINPPNDGAFRRACWSFAQTETQRLATRK